MLNLRLMHTAVSNASIHPRAALAQDGNHSEKNRLLIFLADDCRNDS